MITFALASDQVFWLGFLSGFLALVALFLVVGLLWILLDGGGR